MARWIALFRGINVGGNNLLPMAELRTSFEDLGCKNVRTYIQSGNVVFDHAAKTPSSLVKKIQRRVKQQHGFLPHVVVLDAQVVVSVIKSNPFPNAVSDPKSLHFFFLAEPAVDADLVGVENLKAATENYLLTDHVFYLHAPDGIGRSKLAAKAEKHLRVVATARNYRTVDKLRSLVIEN